MADAPVCHVSTDQVITQPPPVKYPAIPVANDMASALAAINAMRQIINSFIQHGIGTSTSSGSKGFSVQQDKPPKTPPAKWTEIDRKTENVRITNPLDDQQYVDIKQVTEVTLQDKSTKNGPKITIKA